MADNHSAPVGHGTGSPAKGAGMLKNKKVAIGFGIFLVLGIVFVAIHSANKNANSAASQQSAGGSTAVDPATGYPFGSMADSNALGGGFFPGSSGGGSTGSTSPVNVTINNPAPGSSSSSSSSSSSNPPPPKSPPPHHHSSTYIVKPGDNLSEIAARFHISGGWQKLYSLNKHTIGGNPNLIHPGQKLTL